MEVANRNDTPVQLDVIQNGQVMMGGSVARRLMAAGFQPSKLRNNEWLHKEEWLEMDTVVGRENQLRLRGIRDLMDMGLIYDLRRVGLAKTVLQWESISDYGAAEVDMDGVARATQDRLKVGLNQLPLFITHKDVTFTAREIAAAHNSNEPMDMENVQMAARKVAEALETMLFTGAIRTIQLPTAWGSALSYSYTTAPNRVTSTLAFGWLNGSATPASIVQDIMNMKQAAINGRFYGPWILYVPVNYTAVLDKDYSIVTNVVTNTIRQRILNIDGILDIRVADFLPNNNVLLVQMTRDVVDLVVCQEPIILPWEEQGGMLVHFKVLACMVPRMKNTYALRSGIVHYTGS